VITASRLAGFFAAHAIWCVSDNETLTPMLAYTTAAGGRHMERLVVADDLQASVQYGEHKLATNPMDADDAVLLYDGRITTDDGKVDAILIELRAYFAPRAEAILAVPYTPASSGAFRVHRPKLVAWDRCEDFDLDHAMREFFAGVAEHEKGAQVWNDHLDESR
jgi:hypothetical protein